MDTAEAKAVGQLWTVTANCEYLSEVLIYCQAILVHPYHLFRNMIIPGSSNKQPQFLSVQHLIPNPDIFC